MKTSCPRKECVKGYETYNDPSGAAIRVLCWLCKGTANVSKEKKKSYLVKNETRGY